MTSPVVMTRIEFDVSHPSPVALMTAQ